MPVSVPAETSPSRLLLGVNSDEPYDDDLTTKVLSITIGVSTSIPYHKMIVAGCIKKIVLRKDGPEHFQEVLELTVAGKSTRLIDACLPRRDRESVFAKVQTSEVSRLIVVVFGASAAAGTGSQQLQTADSPCAPADSYATLEAGMADKQESPCFFLVAESNFGGEAYHTIYCNAATLAALHASLTDYRQRNCTEEIFLQIAKFDHPLDVSVFRGLETRLRVPIVEREAAAKFYGSPFKELTELLVLDVRLNHLDDSLFLTEAFFKGLRGLRILQTENLAAKLLVALDASRMFPQLKCVGVYETENRNCTCQDAEEITALTKWRMGATKPGVTASTTVADPLRKDLYHACKVGINCYLKDPTSDTYTVASFNENVRKKTCPDYGKRIEEKLSATTTSDWLANNALPYGV
ncbi:hypothetical protein BV898_17638 [Hypsibius exemplaris]|uniref:Uncharacterized protein n=1 Tax=Hypsibius exemplaris TaxID=2072580 RepID=A0A9X6NFG8_HYPEX|nr:hypothetical protein BV898_17638 [Hypsibius exemplaris]